MWRRDFFRAIGRFSLVVSSAVLGLIVIGVAGKGFAQETRPSATTLRDNAHAVVERHCARCHQVGRTPSERTQGGISDILALDELAREGVLVKPGLPEASALFNVLYTGHAPRGFFAKGPSGEPAADEIAAVRDWIASLGEDRDGVCTARRRLGPAHAATAAARSIAAAGPARRKSLRFVSLAHLADACRSAREMAGYSQAIKWAVNAASRAPLPFEPRVVDAEGTVLELDLERLGWDARAWEQLTGPFPLAGLPPFELPAELSAELGTKRAIVSADWLAWAISEPATYAALLGLPEDIAALRKWLGSERSATAPSLKVETSNETGGPREISRPGPAARSIWQARDGDGGDGGVRLAFELENGFQGFAAYDAGGKRAPSSLAEPEVVRSGHAPPTSVSTACLACHSGGPRLAGPEGHPLATLAQQDRARFAATAAKAGIDPTLVLSGRTPMAALAALYEGPVTARRAAAEAGLTPQQLDQQLLRIGGAAAFGARRLRHGAVTRNEALGVYAALLEGGPAGGQDKPADSTASAPRIALWAEADSYVAGQPLSIHAETSSACHLTLINVDARGRATVLFPNGFEPDGLLQPGRPITVPGIDAPYRLRLTERGRETVIAICTATARAIDGIRHDFDRLHFTVLGDWQGFQIRAYEDVGKPVPPPVRERRQVRRRGQAAPRAVEVPPRGSEVQARTAFTIDVR